MAAMQVVTVDGTELEVSDQGSGEPVMLVQTALTADEFAPVAAEAALRDGFRTILYHRRGYGRSTGASGPGSIARDAADCAALLGALEIEQAHVAGVSYSAAVAMQLASEAPRLVRTLTLMEPPPVHTPSAGEFRAVNDRLQRTRREEGVGAALDAFLTMLVGPGWRDEVDGLVPGAAAQMDRDAATFFDTDLPALLGWRFGVDDARRIECPVLHIAGAESGPWFAEVRELVLDWFPQAEDVVIPGAGHSMAMTHPAAVAGTMARFLRRHQSRLAT
ncbi:MAG: alpha/beta fold hydrolase [bacterium]